MTSENYLLPARVGSVLTTTARIGDYAKDLLQTDLAFEGRAIQDFDRVVVPQSADAAVDLDLALFNSRASGKIATANIAMHLDREWRDGFFRQLDSLLDVNEWEPTDRPVTEASFKTFLRAIIHMNADQRPGIGSTANGELIASWRDDGARLVLTCGADDRISWSFTRDVEGEKDIAAGQTSSFRLPKILSGLECEALVHDKE